MELPLVSVVILNWNGLPYVITCLKSVLASDYPRFLVIVIDNGSTDGSDKAIEMQFPNVLLYKMENNLGYAAGNNIGIVESLNKGCDYILLLNNDTEVPPNMIYSVVSDMLQNPQAGVVGVKIYLLEEPDRFWAVGGVFRSNRLHTLGINEHDHGQYNNVKLDFVFGCGILVKSEVFEKIGLLDTRFFFYYEDIDLCLRAKKAGFDVLLASEATLKHKKRLESQRASKFKAYQYERSRILFYCKYLVGRAKLWFVLAQIPHQIVSALRYIYHEKRLSMWLEGICGMFDGFSRCIRLC